MKDLKGCTEDELKRICIIVAQQRDMKSYGARMFALTSAFLLGCLLGILWATVDFSINYNFTWN